MTSRRPKLTSTPVMLAHIVLVVLGWLLFAFCWATVLWRDAETAKHAGLLILLGLIAAPIITLCWVSYNRWIFRRKGARGEGFAPPEEYDNDWSGRSVFAEFPLLKSMRNVHVIPVETAKLYKPFKRISEKTSRRGGQ
jgi:hypothetical protein